MGRRKLNFTSLFSKTNVDPATTATATATSSSPKSYSAASSSPSSSVSFPYWPSCNHPKTNSFQCESSKDDGIYKTMNSVYFDTTDYSAFAHSSDEIFSDSDVEGDPDALIRGLTSSDRLFFEPGGKTSSILREEETVRPKGGTSGTNAVRNPFKGSVVMALDSGDPYNDFRRSMEEMVTANGIKDWGSLEELLVWYLRTNGKKNHEFVIGAFIHLLVGIGFSATATTSSSGDKVSDEEDVAVTCCRRCCSDSMSSVSFEIEELEWGSGSC